MTFLTRFVWILVSIAPGALALAVDAPLRPQCVAAPGLRESLAGIDFWTTSCASPECWAEKVAETETLLEKYPDNLFVHRAYQDTVRRSGDETLRDGLLARYEERVRERPEDPAAHYLLGRVANIETEAGHHERAIELAPEFPWSHISLAAMSARTGEGGTDKQKSLDHLREFMRLCPSQPMVSLQFVRGWGDTAFWRERLPELRERVANEPELRRAQAFTLLWTAEFRTLPPGEHAALRSRIAEDLGGLEALERTEDPHWWRSLKRGYELIGDEDGSKRTEAGIAALRPCSRDAVNARLERWEAEHGRLDAQSPEADSRTFLLATDDWIAQCPDDLRLNLRRFSVASRLADLADEKVLDEVNRVLAVWETHKASTRTARSPYYRAAELLLARDLDLERVPVLLEQERALRERNASRSQAPGGIDDEMKYFRTAAEIDLELTLGDAQIRLGRLEAATDTLSGTEPLLAVLVAQSGDDELFPSFYMTRWWQLRAELSQTRGHPLDAIGFFLRAASFVPEPGLVFSGPGRLEKPFGRAELEQRGRDIWAAAGGSSEGWQALVASSETDDRVTEAGDVVPWDDVEEVLIGFELTDLNGRIWRLSDLEGKVVLVNVWATWCAPCHDELPLLERLFEQFGEREELMLLTLNVDDNPGIVAPYVEKMGFTFPTLLAADFIHELEGGFSIPDNWILDSSGTIRYRQSGFSAGIEEIWMDETLRRMEALVAEKQG